MKKVMLLMSGAFLIAFLLCNTSSKKKDDNIHQNRKICDNCEIIYYDLEEPPPEDLLRMLEEFPIVEVDTNDIILPNGMKWNDFNVYIDSYPKLIER